MQVAPMTPWYRQAWPWLLLLPPLAAVAGGVAMLVIAVQTYDGVVADDYYKRGLEINAEVSRAQRARELGIEAALHVSAAGDAATVQVRATQLLPSEAVVRLRLVHPGRAAADHVALLARSAAAADGRAASFTGSFDAPVASDPPVAWRVVLESERWRIDGAMAAGEPMPLTLRPTR